MVNIEKCDHTKNMVDEFSTALTVAIVLGLLNFFVKPILILFTLPVTIVTLGLFLFVINAVTLLLTDSIMGSSFEIDSFGMALLIAVIMSFINMIVQSQTTKTEKRK